MPRGLRMSDLASRVVLSPSGVTRAVDQLERKGLVERCVFEGDKRGYLATLTPEGRALLRRATNVHVRGVREHFLKHLSRTELEHLATSLEAVLDGEGSPLPPLTADDDDHPDLVGRGECTGPWSRSFASGRDFLGTGVNLGETRS